MILNDIVEHFEEDAELSKFYDHDDIWKPPGHSSGRAVQSFDQGLCG